MSKAFSEFFPSLSLWKPLLKSQLAFGTQRKGPFPRGLPAHPPTGASLPSAPRSRSVRVWGGQCSREHRWPNANREGQPTASSLVKSHRAQCLLPRGHPIKRYFFLCDNRCVSFRCFLSVSRKFYKLTLGWSSGHSRPSSAQDWVFQDRTRSTLAQPTPPCPQAGRVPRP